MATKYWSNKSVANAHWNTLTLNWWDNAGLTSQAIALPIAGDTIVFDGSNGVYPDTGPAAPLTFIAANFINIYGSYSLSGNCIFSGLVQCNDGSDSGNIITLNGNVGYVSFPVGTCTLANSISLMNTTHNSTAHIFNAGTGLTVASGQHITGTTGITIGANAVFQGNMLLTNTGAGDGVNVGNGWKVQSGSGGGTIVIEADGAVSIGTPNAAQVKSFSTITVTLGDPTSVSIMSGTTGVNVSGVITIGTFTTYTGCSFVLTSNSSQIVFPGLGVSVNAPSRGILYV